MKFLKHIPFLVAMLILMASFSQCSTAQKLQGEAPTQFGDVYCQKWVAGVSGGGSGFNLFIPVMNESIKLDSVYFRGKISKLEFKTGELPTYIGRFENDFNQPKDIIISSDRNEEYDNKLSKKLVVIPFELKDDECVVSYIKGDKIVYYKISNIEQKRPVNYPMASPDKNIKLN
jgi:hypothetical protein